MIRVHEPVLGADERTYVLDALNAGEISGSGGRYLQEFEQRFAAYCGVAHGVAVSSGSTALHLAMVLSRIQPGDEVLVSACTNIATANAVVQCAGKVVPVDVEPDTWNMDPRLLPGLTTPRTRAIIPVHIYGHPVAMHEVVLHALRHRLFVVEDCAEAHGALCGDRMVGSYGHVGCFSFYANKVITTGEGGMIVTNDEALATRARLLRNLAFTKPRFMHYENGYNYRMTNLQAALGCAQLNRIEQIIHQKRAIAGAYIRRLYGFPGLRLPVEKLWARNIYWMFGVVIEDNFGRSRDEVMAYLKERGIETRTMFCPLNLQPSLLHAITSAECPQAEYLWTHGLYLPSGCGLTEQDIDFVCSTLREAFRCA